MVDESGTSLILRVLERKQFVRFVDIWACGFWSMGRAEDGRLFACGLNNFGQLGVNLEGKVGLFTCARAFPADKHWTHVSGVQHLVCRNTDGELYGIGKNTDNALGLGTWEVGKC